MVNFIVQGLHHHERVGVFPEMRALFGLSPPSKDGPMHGSELIGESKASLMVSEGEERVRLRGGKKLRQRQVFSTWEEGSK